MKFLSWSTGTVKKAFGWAEAIGKYEHLTMADVELLDIPTFPEISYLTTNMLDVVRDPAYLVLKAILTTPLLSWSEYALDIVRECLENFRDAHTIDRAVYDSVSILRASLTKRLIDNATRQTLSIEERGLTREHFSVELMCALYGSVTFETLDDSAEPTPVFDESIIADMTQRVHSDPVFAEIYANGLLLSPGQIMSAQCVIDRQMDYVQVIRIISHARLWQVLESFARHDINAFMASFEASTLSELINRSVHIKKIVALAL